MPQEHLKISKEKLKKLIFNKQGDACLFHEIRHRLEQMYFFFRKDGLVKKLRVRKLADCQRQEEEDMKYWSSRSIANKTEMVYSLWREHCWINRAIFGLPGEM